MYVCEKNFEEKMTKYSRESLSGIKIAIFTLSCFYKQACIQFKEYWLIYITEDQLIMTLIIWNYIFNTFYF